MSENLWRIFDAVTGATADRPAVRWRKRSQTASELRERSMRLANVLADHGIGWRAPRDGLQPWEAEQDLVATYLLNSPEYLETTFAGFAARALPFNVNYRYVADELAYLLDDASAAAVVYHARFADQLADVLPRLSRTPVLLQVADDSGADLLPGALDYETAIAGSSADLSVDGHAADDLYAVYTGGTTGMPKCTLWRHDDIWQAALGGELFPDGSVDDVVAFAANATGPRFLPNAPFMHAAAHWTAVRTILSGGTVVINSVVDRLDPVDVWSLVESERIDLMLLVGEAFARPLLEELARRRYDVSSLGLVVVGGAPTSPETKQRLIEAVPTALLMDAAGSSETGSALRSIARPGAGTNGAVFEPDPDTTVLDASLESVVQPGHEEAGWFAKRGAIPLGYLGDPEKTRRAFPVVEGVRYSVPGDRARLRTDGRIELLGRDSVTINSGGEKIFAEEVEAALLTHPAVSDVLVVGRASERWGQEVVAVVSLVRGVDDRELLDAATARIARYKLPKAVVRVPMIVRSPAGKADYAWAREVAGAHT